MTHQEKNNQIATIFNALPWYRRKLLENVAANAHDVEAFEKEDTRLRQKIANKLVDDLQSKE